MQIRSILARKVVAIHLALPRLPPALLSIDPFFHVALSKIIQTVVLDIGSGSSNVSGRSLGLVVAFSNCERVSYFRHELLFMLHISSGHAATY